MTAIERTFLVVADTAVGGCPVQMS
jgi:hypothetical protein